MLECVNWFDFKILFLISLSVPLILTLSFSRHCLFIIIVEVPQSQYSVLTDLHEIVVLYDIDESLDTILNNNWTGSLAPNSTSSFTLPVLSGLSSGKNEIQVLANLGNSFNEYDYFNNSTILRFSIIKEITKKIIHFATRFLIFSAFHSCLANLI